LQEPNCWVDGKCIGDLLSYENDVPTKEDCLKLCKNETACKWVTFHQAESVCMLLKQCNTLDESDENDFLTAERRCKVYKGITKGL